MYRGGHPILRAPDKSQGQIAFASTASDWRARLNTVAQLRRMGADLDAPPVTRDETVTPVEQSADMAQTIDMPWTDREWRELQRDSEAWWRQLYAPPANEPEPEAAPEPEPGPRVSRYGAALMARLTSASTVRADAQGNGRWTLAEARQMLRDGYSLDSVVERTGWGRMWLADLADRLAAE